MAAGIRGFRPVPHRLEPVLERDGVLWVNDSKATNAESAVVGLQAFAGRPLVWIGGGHPETEPPTALLDAVTGRARAAVVNGGSAALIDAALARRGFAERSRVATLADAVAAAREVARPGDVVLLSPGYKSFDQFRDFEERGDVFRELVRAGAPQGAGRA
jgi:UDP-N-acetylmuramoylalanine--D-glutamate ligase